MIKIKETIAEYKNLVIDKPEYIKKMYELHHAKLFDFANYINETNIKKIELISNSVIITSRDRGVRIICQPYDHRIAPIEILNFKDYEIEESRMMENLIGENDCFFDIGANIGWYSINIALANRGVKVYSFEPIPKTYTQLLKNIKINTVENIKTYNFGFSNKNGEFPFYYYPEGSGNASSVNVSGRENVEVLKCQLKTLDEFSINNSIKPDFIKCDVEGGELMVFQGGERVIKDHKPIVFSEILRKWSEKFGYHPNEIFTFFYNLGYEAFTAKDGCLSKFEQMDRSTIETNFFFLHSEKHKMLMSKYIKK